MDQCEYSKTKKVIEDAKIVLQNYMEMYPILTEINIPILELQGNIPIQYNETIFQIFIILRFQTSHPQFQPFIFLKNVDTNKFDANPLYKSAEIQNGQFISFNTFIPSGKSWNQNYKIINLLSEIQSALTRNFPFFLKSYTNNLNQSQQQYQPIMCLVNQSQHNSHFNQQSQFQQSQFHIQLQQPSNNSYSNINQQQQQLQQSEYILKLDQSQKKQQEEQGMANKLFQISSSVFEFGKELLISQEAKEEKIKIEVKSKVDIELLYYSKILMESIKQQKELTDTLIDTYLRQTRVIQEVQLKDQEINASIHQLDQQLMQMEQKIETCVTTISQLELNNIEEQQILICRLTYTDPLSNQIIDLTGEIQAEKEGLYFLQKKFRYQNLDYGQLIKITRQMSQQMFDHYLLLRKCVTSQY